MTSQVPLPVMSPIVSLIFGIAAAGIGGHWFVRGAVAISLRARIPASVVGATIAAFATSSPELAVSIAAAQRGQPDIALGDALGANVVNVAFILGLVLLAGPLPAAIPGIKRDLPVALGAPLLTGVLLLDGNINRLDACLMIGVFSAWLLVLLQSVRKDRKASRIAELRAEAEEAQEMEEAIDADPKDRLHIARDLAFGITALALAGNAIVQGAKGIGESLGLDPFVVGVTLVAIGTTVPELVTTLIARLKGHQDVALGTVLGSNIFNGLLIVAVAGLINPIEIKLEAVWPALLAGTGAILLCLPFGREQLSRRRGVALMGTYVAFVTWMIVQR